MNGSKRKIAIFFTGGTIAMRKSADGALRPALGAPELLSELPGPLPGDAELVPVDWAELPSPHVTPELMFQLAGDVQAMLERDDIAGAVVTHGTDVMEESAFMLDLLLDTDKPVVLTGSMRSSDEAGFDGMRNLSTAVRACLRPLPPKTGVALLMADKIFAAREVTKMHSMAVDSFGVPGGGPLGTCMAGGIQMLRLPIRHKIFKVRSLETRVDLITVAAGFDGRLVAFCRDNGARGIVIQGVGAGNVPPRAIGEIKTCLEAGLPVVVTSRCIEGGVWPVYGYKGGANELHDMGAILGGNLLAQKARLLLMVALSAEGYPGAPMEKARQVFAEFPN